MLEFTIERPTADVPRRGAVICRRPAPITALIIAMIFAMLTTMAAAPAMAGATAPAETPAAPPAPPAGRPAIRVVGDASYAPMEFLDEAGRPQGIFVDIWRLWSKRTGIAVEYRLMNWSDALRAVADGRADAISSVFYSPERAHIYDFSEPLVEVTTHIFFHQNIYGIRGMDDLSGFRVGVVYEDMAEDYLRRHRPGAEVVTFTTYADMIRAAVGGEVRIFICDTPIALYHLSRLDTESVFSRAAEPLYTSMLRAGTRKGAMRQGQGPLMDVIAEGFGRISPREIEAIQRQWIGVPAFNAGSAVWRTLLWVVVLLGSLITGIVVWNVQLRRRVTAATMDLAEKHRALEVSERFSHQSESRYRELIDLIPYGIMEINPSGGIMFVNRAGCRMFGYDDIDLIGKKVWELAATDHLQNDFHKFFQLVLANRPDPAPYQGKGGREDGTRLDIQIDWCYRLGEKDRIDGFLCVVTDTTRRLRAERQRRQLESQLAQVRRMESLGTLAGGIAHDFNNLMTGIQGSAALLLARMPQEGDGEHLRNILSLARSGTGLTRRLLGFARQEPGQVAPMDISAIVAESAAMFGRTARHIAIVQSPPDPDAPHAAPWAAVDRDQLERVLLNLFVNAADAMPEGGRLTLNARVIQLDRDAAPPHDLPPGPYVAIRVADTGAGMAPGVRERIFEPFFTTKPTGRGTGLGLASAYGIIKNYNGFIQVESAPGQGACFTIHLPATPPGKNAAPAASPVIERGTETLLVIDDDPIIRKVTAAMLSEMGYKALKAGGGAEAMGLLARNRDIRLVIMDLMMPDMDGAQTYAALKEIDETIRIILVSGCGMHEKAATALSAGCDGFIQKPFDMAPLSRLVRRALDRKDRGAMGAESRLAGSESSGSESSGSQSFGDSSR